MADDKEAPANLDPFAGWNGPTSEDIARFVRIGLYYFWGGLGYYGFSQPDEGTKAIIISVTGGLATLVWSIWGMRLVNKLREIAKYQEVKKVVVATPEIEASTPDKVKLR